MALMFPTHFKFKLFNLPNQNLHTHFEVSLVSKPPRTNNRPFSCLFLGTHFNNFGIFVINPNSSCSTRKTLIRMCTDGGNTGDTNSQQSSYSTSSLKSFPLVLQDIETLTSGPSNTGDGYVSLFVRMLGLDNDPLDREQAVVALWKYSLGGKQCVDAIMGFHGSINLVVNLLKSESTAACEAAAGLLRMISSINIYRESVAESGAIEELSGLLRRSSIVSDVKEQSICTLWNLTVDERLQLKIANSDLLPLLIKFLEDEDMRVVEAAGGVLANLAISHSNHKIMVEAGVISKLAKFLKTNEGSKVTRKEAKGVLLGLAKDDYYRILIMEEGLVLVPLIGTASYKSFRPSVHSWPSLPDGTEIEQRSKGPSRFGAAELLLGLNVQDNNSNIEEAKMSAIVGRTHQQFLARIGAIELEDHNLPDSESSSSRRLTILPWMDGIARLVLILGLQDETAIARAAGSIADASISEHMRVSFKEAGAVKHLVQLMDHHNDSVRLAVIHALERLSVSNDVCERIEAEGVLHPLVNSLKFSETSGSRTDMILNILARILDPNKEMKLKFYDGSIDGSKNGWDTKRDVESAQIGDEMSVSSSTSSQQTVYIVYLSDPAFIARLIEILKTPFPVLQRKAASILEYMAADESLMDKMISTSIHSGFDNVFRQNVLNDTDSDLDYQQPELYAVEVEEAGLAISAAARLFTRLLDSEKFRQAILPSYFTELLRKILISSIPLHNKDWVAACLVKLSSLSSPNSGSEAPISKEVTMYERIPRLVEQIKSSFSPEAKEAAVVELNKIVSEGVVDFSKAVTTEGGIFALVKLIDEGNGKAVDAGIAILYNLSMDSENHPAIIAAGAVPVLRRIVLSQRSQWTQALHLLRILPTL